MWAPPGRGEPGWGWWWRGCCLDVQGFVCLTWICSGGRGESDQKSVQAAVRSLSLSSRREGGSWVGGGVASGEAGRKAASSG